MAYLTNDGLLKLSFDGSVQDDRPERIFPFANSSIFNSKVTCAVKLTHGDDVQSVYDLGLDLEGVDYDFLPGDAIGILPSNDQKEANDILQLIGCGEICDKGCSIIVNNDKKKRAFAHIPARTTIRDVFCYHVDIRTPPKKAFLKTLAKYCTNEEEVTFLEKLCRPENSADYLEFLSTTGRSLLQTLGRLPSCKLPLDILLENLAPLQPRPYSISSSPLLKSRLHITFSVVEVTKDRKGVCTSYLENCARQFLSNKADITIKFYFRKPNLFRFPTDLSKPVIMIGPGTGVAPFRGFLQHLAFLDKKIDTWLFFGCRYKEDDFLYKSEFEKYLGDGYLQKLTVAFSREQIDKIYVTHLMKTESERLYSKLVSNAVVYVCGDATNMMKDVKDAVLWCLEDNGMSSEEAQDSFKNLLKENRYIEDKWL